MMELLPIGSVVTINNDENKTKLISNGSNFRSRHSTKA